MTSGSTKQYAQLKLETLSGMTNTAQRLYQYTAAGQPAPADLSVAVFQRMCGVPGLISAWTNEVERACRELVSSQVVKAARVENGWIIFS